MPESPPRCDRKTDEFGKYPEDTNPIPTCDNNAEFKVKFGSVWGHYCGEHILEFMRSNNWNPEEEPIYPIDYEVDEVADTSKEREGVE